MYIGLHVKYPLFSTLISNWCTQR